VFAIENVYRKIFPPVIFMHWPMVQKLQKYLTCEYFTIGLGDVQRKPTLKSIASAAADKPSINSFFRNIQKIYFFQRWLNQMKWSGP
jgi:hypothetical protein